MFINGEFVESKTDKWVDLHNPVSCTYICTNALGYVNMLSFMEEFLWMYIPRKFFNGISFTLYYCSYPQNQPNRV